MIKCIYLHIKSPQAMKRVGEFEKLSHMNTLTFNQQQTQNTNLFNMRMSQTMTRAEVLEFCKRAKISACCDLIDDEVKEQFHKYYGYMPFYNINSGCFEMFAI